MRIFGAAEGVRARLRPRREKLTRTRTDSALDTALHARARDRAIEQQEAARKNAGTKALAQAWKKVTRWLGLKRRSG